MADFGPEQFFPLAFIGAFPSLQLSSASLNRSREYGEKFKLTHKFWQHGYWVPEKTLRFGVTKLVPPNNDLTEKWYVH